MRDTTNVLFSLEDRVGIVMECDLLPDINFPSPPQSAQGLSQPTLDAATIPEASQAVAAN